VARFRVEASGPQAFAYALVPMRAGEKPPAVHVRATPGKQKDEWLVKALLAGRKVTWCSGPDS
jgi:hypothetical protein